MPVARKTGEVGGWVTNAEGQGLQNICVTVYKAGTSRVVVPAAPTSVDATFMITNLKPGRYTLRFTDCDPDRSPKYASEWWEDSKRQRGSTVVTIVAAETVIIDQVTLALKPVRGHHGHH